MDGWWAASYIVLWLLVVVLSIVVVALARQIGTLHLRLGPRGALEVDTEGPPIGEAPAPSSWSDLTGSPVEIAGPGRWQVVLFASPSCHLCDQIAPSLHIAARSRSADAVVVVDADEHETRLAYSSKDLAAPVIAAPELVRSFEIPGTPFVVVLDDLGVVRAKGTANNLEQLEGLIDTAIERSRRDEVAWSSAS
ncbi:MAG: hypothetical protein M3277_07970 [Actinomycetota bacterium]|nr:hypothetical protein [Actinomycetota bacterium]